MKLAVLEEAGVTPGSTFAIDGPHRPRRRQFGHLPGGKKFLGIRISCASCQTPRTRPSSASWVSRPPSAPRPPWPRPFAGALELPDPVGAKARASTAAAVAAAGPATAKGRRRWHRRRRGDPGAPRPSARFWARGTTWGKSAGDRHGKDARRQPCAGHRPGRAGRRRSGPGPARARYVGVAVMFVGLAEACTPGGAAGLPDEVALAPCFIFPGIGAAMAGYLVYFASPDPAPGARLTRGQAAACTVLVWVLAIAVYALPYVAAGLLSPSGRLRVHQRADHHGLKRGGRGRLPGHLPVPPPASPATSAVWGSCSSSPAW